MPTDRTNPFAGAGVDAAHPLETYMEREYICRMLESNIADAMQHREHNRHELSTVELEMLDAEIGRRRRMLHWAKDPMVGDHLYISWHVVPEESAATERPLLPGSLRDNGLLH